MSYKSLEKFKQEYPEMNLFNERLVEAKWWRTVGLRELNEEAEQGHTDAQYKLGWMYHNGRGVTQDDKMAVKWYTLAAEQGHVDAQYFLDEFNLFGCLILRC